MSRDPAGNESRRAPADHGSGRSVDESALAQTAPDVRAVPVTALVQRAPTICGPETTIREAARLMSQEVVSAILVRVRDGFGIVTNSDLRDRVVAAGVSPDASVVEIMSAPVKTVRAETLAPEAAVEMMDAGVKHLPVVEADGRVVGVLAADSFMTLEALSPFALRRSIATARGEDEVVSAAARLPEVFFTLLGARLEAPAISRVLTSQHNAISTRLIELAIARLGPPPVPFAWLLLGSAARGELSLASDQDNALAFGDADDLEVDAYFERLAEAVNAGLVRCGWQADISGVVARNSAWRMSESQWVGIFIECLEAPSHSRLMRAAVSFDFRQLTGELAVVPSLVEVIRSAPKYPGFLASLAGTVTEIPSPLGFRRRLTGSVDLKKQGMLPVENLARYFALENGVVVPSTLDRLEALEERGILASDTARSLGGAFALIGQLRLQRHASLLRDGRPPSNQIDTDRLSRLTRAGLQEAMRVIDGSQKLLPPPLHGW
jgi:CBS domain-containing protein